MIGNRYGGLSLSDRKEARVFDNSDRGSCGTDEIHDEKKGQRNTGNWAGSEVENPEMTLSEFLKKERVGTFAMICGEGRWKLKYLPQRHILNAEETYLTMKLEVTSREQGEEMEKGMEAVLAAED